MELAAYGRRGGDVDSGFRRKDGWGVAGPMGTGGHTDAGERTWIPGFAGKTGGEWRDLWELAGIRTPGRGRGFRLLPERRVGSGGVYGNWRAYGAGEGTWIPAFAGKTGGEWRDLWELVGIRPSGKGRGFRLSPERRVGNGGTYGSSWVFGHRGGDVDSGFCRKDGVGPSGRRRRGLRLSLERREWWLCLWQPAGLEKPGGTWIPAFDGN